MKNEFIYGGHIFALCAVSIVLLASILLDVLVTIDFLAIIYLIFYAIYLNDHFKDMKTDVLTNTQRVTYLKKNKKIPLLIFISVVASELLLFYFGSITGLFLGSVIIILGLFYSKCFKKITRRIAAFKNFFVALVWSVLVFYLFIYYSYFFTYETIFVAVFIFLRIFIIQILLDIRDIKSDRKEKLLTIPILFGKETSIKIIVYLNILGFLLLFYGIYLGILSNVFLLLFLVFLYSFYYINKLKSIENNNMFYFLAAIEPIVLLIFVLIGNFLL
ncbi:MAG: UbiA family prenyltransferase [Candidatus Pacebacteria bacterium]|nr:UbiA family prenyltransferase [Candidatus Paceibacterota bacterium]